MIVRPASALDAGAIRQVHEAAFPTSAEADLVERLEQEGDAAVSLVAEEDEVIVGHILLSRMDAEADGRPLAALGLAPVAVLPSEQRRGVGGALIVAALEEARRLNSDMVFVLGEPGYYGRFGFSAEAAAAFRSPYASPYLQAINLTSTSEQAHSGRADYARAFGELG